MTKLDEFTEAYVACALWCGASPNEADGIDSDRSLDISDLHADTLAGMIADCGQFQARHGAIIDAAADTDEVRFGPDCHSVRARAGHDFWLTRNGHGAGFWDGDWPEPYATQLDEASKSFGGRELYVGDDGKVYSG